MAVALKQGFSHLSFTAAELKLPGVTPGDNSAPGRRLAAMDLGAVCGEIGSTCERLDRCSTAGNFLQLPEIDSGNLPALPSSLTPVVDSLESYLPAIARSLRLLLAAGRELDAAFALLTAAEKVRLRALTEGFEFWRDEWPDYSVQEMIGLAGKVDRARITTAGAYLAECVAAVRTSAVMKDTARSEPVSYATPWGEIVIGTAGSDHYGTRAMLIVDLGGEDSYAAQSGRALGGAVCGASWLEDVSGDDRYKAGPFSLGCGVLGIGVLVDREGDDTYEGTSLTQGAAFYGLGALVDLEGDDRYRADFGAQGACFASGDAVLADLGGDDRYFAGRHFRDYRSPGAFKSFAQGCAAGIRPLADGGRAVLYDRAGDDSLEIGYLGQGAGYWGGFGLLACGGGNSVYRAERYAQGCGLHFAAGALVESAGNDTYTLEGVGQGAAEDRAWGVVVERGGNDRYESSRLARGAGGTGGVGLLLECGGDDTYPADGQVTGGAGSRTWELPGIGLMFDLRGRDIYGDKHDDGKKIENGAWGARLDLAGDR